MSVVLSLTVQLPQIIRLNEERSHTAGRLAELGSMTHVETGHHAQEKITREVLHLCKKKGKRGGSKGKCVRETALGKASAPVGFLVNLQISVAKLNQIIQVCSTNCTTVLVPHL